MNDQTNVEVIQQLHDAFVRQDVQAIVGPAGGRHRVVRRGAGRPHSLGGLHTAAMRAWSNS